MKLAVLIALALAANPSLDSARASYASARTALAAAQAQVAGEQKQLDALAAKIAADKARQPGQPLFVPGALEQELAQSQALSDQLARSRADQSARAADMESARGALYGALSAEISVRESQHPNDAAALDALAKLEAERAQVAPSAQAIAPGPKFTRPTDDPTLLRERADALRDQADKLGKQEVALAARIQAARDQAELEDQLRQLNGDESLFDESDRRVTVTATHAESSRTTDAAAAGNVGQVGTSGGAGGGGAGGSNEAVQAYGGGNATPESGGTAVNSPAPAAGGPAPSSVQPQALPGATPVPSTESGELVRPDQLARTGAAPLDDDASLDDLLRAQKQLAAERQALEAQARALDAQAASK